MKREYMIMQNDSGYFVAVRVPMNNLSGYVAHFWRQASKCYARRDFAAKALERIAGRG